MGVWCLAMSENTADLSAKFSPEEWNLIESAPFLAGLSVALSDLRQGLFGAIKESLVPFEAITEAGDRSFESSRRFIGCQLQGDGCEARTASIPDQRGR
jgi:hypothetical protein